MAVTVRERAASDHEPRSLTVAVLIVALACVFATPRARSDDTETESPAAPAAMKPTEVGVRFTPRMAHAISGAFLKRMRSRYELDDGQSADIRKILAQRLMTLARDNAEAGRDSIELLMEGMIAGDGGFSKDDAVEFGKRMEPIIPALKSFFTEASAEISGKMTMTQRLKYMGDMAGVTAGLLVLENRMKRWRAGEVGDHVNPFDGRGDADAKEADATPEDPDETPEHRRARRNVERQMDWRFNIDRKWKAYVDQAIEYYQLGDAQVESAQAILKDCQARLAKVKTPELRAALLENRIAQQLTWRTKSTYNQGPWMYKLEEEFERLRKPLIDLEKELKRRIEALPDSRQRAVAEEGVRSVLRKKGLKKIGV
ncbi:MAG: hypothetical protein ACE5F9_12270 [Phycisphaerae bacterium]